MYPSSGTFQSQVWATERQFNYKLEVDASTGPFDLTKLEITNLALRDAVVSGNHIEVGTAVARELTFTVSNLDDSFDDILFAGALITFTVDLNNLGEWIPMGTFYVDEAPRIGKNIAVVAYDAMIRFERMFSGVIAPTTPLALLQQACSIAGINLYTTSFLHNTYQVNKIPEGATCREIVQYVAQLAGCFARINRNNQLILKWYTDTSESVSSYNIFKLTLEEPIEVTGIEYGEYMFGDEGYVVVLRDNPLITDDAVNVVAAIGARIVGTAFTPGKIEHRGDPTWDAGEFVQVTDEKDRTFKVSTGDNFFNMDGFRCTTISAAESLDQSGYASGKSSKRMSEIRRIVAGLVEQEVTAREIAIENVTNLFHTVLGGNVLKRENELLIMDDPDPELALRIWRWSLAGLGYSDNVVGADHEDRIYTTAITMDGTIVANFIATGTLSADVIGAGSITSDHVATGTLTINNMAPGLGVDLDISGNPSFVSLASSITVIEGELAGITSFYSGEGVPTLLNYPADDWVLTETEQNHIGDKYIDTLTGLMYRFLYDESTDTYSWILIPDSELTELAAEVALNTSAIAQSAEAIQLKVSQDVYAVDQNGVWTAISTAMASIAMTAYEIDLRVQQNGVISAINLSPEEISISSTRIAIDALESISLNIWAENQTDRVSYLEISEEDIVLRVNALEEDTDALLASFASFEMRADQIELRVYEEIPAEIEGLENAVNSFDSRITINSQNIELKVSESDYTGAEIISRINLTSTSATIEAERIDLKGVTTLYAPGAEDDTYVRYGATDQFGQSYGDLSFYDNNQKYFEIYNGITEVVLAGMTGTFLVNNHTDGVTYPIGVWDFTDCTPIGLEAGGAQYAVFG